MVASARRLRKIRLVDTALLLVVPEPMVLLRLLAAKTTAHLRLIWAAVTALLREVLAANTALLLLVAATARPNKRPADNTASLLAARWSAPVNIPEAT